MPNEKVQMTIDESIIDKENMLNVIGELPDMFLQQITKLAYYYLGYTALPNSKTEERTEYINEVCNAFNILIKLCMTASDGVPIGPHVRLDFNPAEALTRASVYLAARKTKAKAVVEMVNEAKAKKPTKEEIVAKQKALIESELNLWGIDKTSYGYQAISSLNTFMIEPGQTTNDLIAIIAKTYGHNNGVTAASISKLIKKADFSKSEIVQLHDYVEEEKDITTEILLGAILNYLRKSFGV